MQSVQRYVLSQEAKYGDNLPSVDSVVGAVLVKELEYIQWVVQHWGGRFGASKLSDRGYWKQRCTDYRKIERHIRNNPDEHSFWPLAGPLHYGMSFQEMRRVVIEKLQQMVRSGHLIRNSELERRQAAGEAFFIGPRPSDLGCDYENLTRIWGAEYLNLALSGNTNSAAAEHYLIVPDDNSELLFFTEPANGFPMLSGMQDGKIAAQFIQGNDVVKS